MSAQENGQELKVSFWGRVRQYFITGLVLLIPVTLTIFILFQLFDFIDNILGKFVDEFLQRHFALTIPGLGFILFVLVVIVIGFLTSKVFSRHRMFIGVEKWFSGLPLIKTIYPVLKQMVMFVAEQKELGFKKVVLVEYPSKGIWSLGFLTHESFKKLSSLTGKDLVSVYVSTVPGPLTGMLIFVAREEVKVTDIPVAEALKIIISGGVVDPCSD